MDIEAAVGAYEAHEEANQALSGQIRMERLRKRLEARPEWLSKARPSGGSWCEMLAEGASHAGRCCVVIHGATVLPGQHWSWRVVPGYLRLAFFN